MFATNPFSILAETVPSVVMQGFVVLMILLIVAGTLLDIIHKKNVKYFFENAKKAKTVEASDAEDDWVEDEDGNFVKRGD